MTTQEMSSKVFSFEKNIFKNDLTKDMQSVSKNIDHIIKNLSCMREIDPEFLPKFKFF